MEYAQAKVEPQSQPELAEEPAAPSEPIQPGPRQSEPSRRTRAGFSQPASNRFECASVGYTLKETTLSVVCAEISALSMLRSCRSLLELSRTFFADTRLGPSSVCSPLTPPRTPSRGVSGWVRISALKPARSVAQDSPSLVEDTGPLKVTIFVCALDALYETPLRFDTVEG